MARVGGALQRPPLSGDELVAPGSLLGAEHHLRITLGYAPSKVRMALERVSAAVASLDTAVRTGR